MRENSAFSILIGRNLRPFSENTVLSILPQNILGSITINSPDDDNSLTIKKLFGDNTSQSADKVTSAVNDYDFLEPHGWKLVGLVTIEVSTFFKTQTWSFKFIFERLLYLS